MTYATLATVSAGNVIAEAWGNQVKANFDAGPNGLATAAGQLFVATGAGALAALNKGTALQVLRVNAGGTALEYATLSNAPGGAAGGVLAGTYPNPTLSLIAQPLLFGSDGSYDVGASGATRPRHLYMTGNVVAGGSGSFASPVSIGAFPATQGELRLVNTGSIYARNVAGSGNVQLLALDSSDFIQIGTAAASVIFNVGGSAIAYVAATGVNPVTHDTFDLGTTALRWRDVWCQRAAFNGSSRALKRDITPVDPAAALAAVRDTEVVAFRYEPTDEHDAGAELLQVGFVAEDAPDILSPDHAHASAATTAGVALAAIQALAAEVAELRALVAAR